MWKTPLTTSTPLDLEGIGSERTELSPYGDRVYHYHLFKDLTYSGEMIKDIGVSVVAQPMNGFGWVQYRGYCPFAKKNPWGESKGTMAPPGLGLIDGNITIAIPGDIKAVPKEKDIFEILDYEKTNKIVEKMFSRKWRVNAKRNKSNNPTLSGLKEYADTLYNKSVILIGAGPSLKNNVDLLQDTRITKIAMLHALPFLEKKGVSVDFVVHTDAMSGDKVFVTESSKDITLLANVIVAPSVLRKWKGKKKYYSGTPDTRLTNDISKIADIDSRVTPMGCSMGAAMWIFDKIFNAQNFIFVGNDLCFSDGNTHVWDGQPVSTHELAGVNSFKISDESTGKIHETCYQFTLYKHNIEIYTQGRERTTNKRFVNATEGGILCLNETMTLSQAIKEFDYE